MNKRSTLTSRVYTLCEMENAKYYTEDVEEQEEEGAGAGAGAGGQRPCRRQFETRGFAAHSKCHRRFWSTKTFTHHLVRGRVIIDVVEMRRTPLRDYAAVVGKRISLPLFVE